MRKTDFYPPTIKLCISLVLSYLLLTSQLAPVAFALGSSTRRNASENSVEDIRMQSESASRGNTAEPGKDRDHSFAPVPVPLNLAPAVLAPNITATKVDTYPSSPGGALPGETIRYTITINNSGPDPATNVTLSDIVDVNTAIVGTPKSTPIGFPDSFSVLGNVRIQVPDGASDLLANDRDPDTDTNAGLTITKIVNDTTAPFSDTTAQGGQVTATTGNGAFEYNPAPGFTGTDTFTYIVSDADGNSQPVTVTLTVTGLIWFVNSALGVNGDGRLTSPFNCLVGAGCFDPAAADDPGDNIFLFSGNYTGGLTFLANQKLIGAGASASLATIAGVTVPSFSDALPSTGVANPVITTVAAATNALNVSGGGNTLRGFTVGNTTGAKIFGNTFGTLTAGNNTPDLLLNGTGMALNLTNGTFAATSAFNSVTTTSSTAQGISLIQVAGTIAFGSTTVSSSTTQGILVQQSTADINFGNTVVGTGVAGTGGTNGVALLNNGGGTRTFGTLTIQNNNGPSNSAFLSATGGGGTGGGNAVVGTTSIPNVPGTGNGIDIQNLAGGTSVTFGATSVNKASPGSLVNLTSNVGNVSFLSLGGTNTNGAGLTGTENTGSITVTSNTGSLTTTLGAALSITKAAAPATPITLNFTALSSTNSGTQGVNLDRVSGNLTTGTTTVNNSTGTGIQVQNTSAGGTMNFGNTNSSNSGNANSDATGTGVFLNANAGAVTFADLDISPDANERGFDANACAGTITSTSGTISTTDAPAVIIASSLLSMTLTSVSADNTGDADSCVSLTTASGTLNMQGGALTGGNTAAFLINGGTVASTYSGTITQNTAAQRAIDIQNKTGGISAFGGLVTATTTTANAIHLVSNSGATVNFTAGMSLTTTSGIAFNATGGGTVNATQDNTTIFNTISSTTGTALNVANTTIGASGLTFRSISSNGAASGIILNTTGASGGLTVTGDNTSTNNGSGGTIQNTTSHGISLNNTRNVSLDQLNISTTAGSGIDGVSVTNFSYTNGTITGAGNSGFDSAIAFNGSGTQLGNNIAGTLTVISTTFTNPFYAGLDVQANDGTVTSANVSNNTISNPGFSGINFATTGTSTAAFSLNDATINQNNISGSGGNGIQISVSNGNTTGPRATAGIPNDANNRIDITNNSISIDSGGTQAITVANNGGNSGSRTRTHFLIECNGKNTGGCTAPTANPITGSLIGTTVLIGNNGFSTMVGTVNNNIIDSNHTPGDLGGGGNGIAVANGTGGLPATPYTPDLTATVTNNVITDTNGNGILVVNRTTASGILKAKISSNTVAAPNNTGGSARQGIRVDAGNSSSVDDAVFLNISGNTSAGSNGAAGLGVRKQGTVQTTNDFGIFDAPGGNTLANCPNPTNTDVQNFINAQNPAGNGTDIISGSAYECDTTQAPPLQFTSGGVEAIDAASILPFADFSSDSPISLITSNELNAASISQQQLDTIVAAAKARWIASGLTTQQADRMQGLRFEVSDLEQGYLGEATADVILVDRNAQGKGWFVDPTPGDDSEFSSAPSSTRRYTDPFSAPAGHVDLLTGIEHEIGHKLGLDDSYAEKDRDSIMFGYLTMGERRLPRADEAKTAILNRHSGRHFLAVEPNSETLSQPVAKESVEQSALHSDVDRSFITPLRQQAGRTVIQLASETSDRPASVEQSNRLQQPEPPKPTDIPDPSAPVIGPGGSSITWNVGTIPAGQSVTIVFDVQVENPYSGPAQVSNQGSISFGGGGGPVLTDDPSVGGASDPTVTPILVPPDVSINNAKVAEPISGTTSMLFTVALSAPAQQTITINYNTADGTAVAPGDYAAAVNQTVTFVVGEQLKMIPITVNSDADGAEADETFTVTISADPTQANVVGATGTGTITVANPAGTLLISELRTSGPSGSADEFVEIYNNSDSAHVVAATNGSTGYGVFKMGANCNATPILVGTIPNGTNIPARGHYLLVGSAYSLAGYGGSGAAAGNLTMTSDIENDRNVSLFSTTNIAALSTTTRFDAVGFGTNTGNVCDLQREGTNLGVLLGSTLQYTFFRKECDFVLGPGCTTPALPKDTNNNSADFLFADTAATLVSGAGQHLGAPAPENLASPIKGTGTPILLLDPSVPQNSPPNFARDLTSDPANNSTLGTMLIRRRVVNNTGAPVTRLRFRIGEITTAPPPGGIADLRVRTSTTQAGVGPVNDPATCAATGTPTTVPCTVTVQGLTLETPPAQAMGGGYNSTVTLNLGTPLAAGASANVQFLFGVQQTGTLRVFGFIQALPNGGGTFLVTGGPDSPTASPSTIGGRIVDQNDSPVSGATVTLAGAETRRTITDFDGRYVFENVITGSFYTLTPSRPNYTFTPASRSFSQLGNYTDAAFAATLDQQIINPLDTADFFVRQHYIDFLGRDPDEAGFNFWSDQILQCGANADCVQNRRINVSAAYFLSIEFQKTGVLVDGIYRAAYGRRPLFSEFIPDARAVGRDVVVGQGEWQQQLETNAQAFVNDFTQRADFRVIFDGLSNAEYVNALIAHTGVSFTTDERNELVAGLDGGTLTRASVLRQIAEDERFIKAKFNETFVMMEYFGYLRRDPDAAGYAFWLNKLNEFGGNFERAEMVKAFIISGEYRDRFPR